MTSSPLQLRLPATENALDLPVFTPVQHKAIQGLIPGETQLIEGVAGSGKTAVVLGAADQIVKALGTRTYTATTGIDQRAPLSAPTSRCIPDQVTTSIGFEADQNHTKTLGLPSHRYTQEKTASHSRPTAKLAADRVQTSGNNRLLVRNSFLANSSPLFIGIAPNRLRCERLNQSLPARTWPLSRPFITPSAWAFNLLWQFSQSRNLPWQTPELLTGPEEETRLKDLLAQNLVSWPAPFSAEVVQSDFFLAQLRSLFAFCSHWGIDELTLTQWAKSYRQPAWEASAKLLTYFQPTIKAKKWDSAQLLDQAGWLLGHWEEDSDVLIPPPVPGWILVDDLQDCSAGLTRLLIQMHRRGSSLLACSNSRLPVESFRGGNPGNLQLLSEELKIAPSYWQNSFIASPEKMAHLSLARPRDLRASAPSSTPALNPAEPNPGGSGGQKPGGGPPALKRIENQEIRYPTGPDIKVLRASSPWKQAEQIAQILRHYRLTKNIAWSQMVIIGSKPSVLQGIIPALKANDLPVDQTSRPISFATNRVTRGILDLFCLPEGELSAAQNPETNLGYLSTYLPAGVLSRRYHLIEQLLLGPLFGLSSYHLLRINRAVCPEELGKPKLKAEFYASVGTSFFPGVHLVGLETESEVLNQAHLVLRKASTLKEAVAAEALSQIWETLNLASKWREAAISGNENADEALDAVISLFRNCDVWMQRNPGGKIGQYLDFLLGLNQPVDTLAVAGQRPPGVQLSTAVNCAGRRWQVAVVIGVQEGQWPGRGSGQSLLNLDLLCDLAKEKANISELGNLIADPVVRRKEYLLAQSALFETAITRGDQAVILSAIDNLSEAPSHFFHLLANRVGENNPEPDTSATAGQHKVEDTIAPVASVASLRRLVAQLRQAYLDANRQQKTQIAQTLKMLSKNGISYATPATWRQIGTVPAEEGSWWTSANSAPPGSRRQVNISPSAIDQVERCPFYWFMSTNGARTLSGSTAAQIGTLVHYLAETCPDGDEAQLLDLFQELYPFPEGAGWIERRDYLKDQDTVKRLATYLQESKGSVKGWQLEQQISAKIDPDTWLRARIDRIEYTSQGVQIIDFKTEKNALSKPQAQAHNQLAAYQLALYQELWCEKPQITLPEDTPNQLLGASLVYLRINRGKEFPYLPQLRTQQALGRQEALLFKQKFLECAEIMRGKEYQAIANKNCTRCALRRLCPMQKGNQTL